MPYFVYTEMKVLPFYPSHTVGPSDGRSRLTVLYRVNTFCPVRRPVMLDFTDTKSDRTPDRTSFLRVNTRCPVRRPVRLCVRLIAVKDAGIPSALMFHGTHFSLQNVKIAPATHAVLAI
jgi:hypothetical protein